MTNLQIEALRLCKQNPGKVDKLLKAVVDEIVASVDDPETILPTTADERYVLARMFRFAARHGSAYIASQIGIEHKDCEAHLIRLIKLGLVVKGKGHYGDDAYWCFEEKCRWNP